MGFLKRMRRHKNFPHSGNFFPIFDLISGDIVIGYRFSVISENSVRAQSFDGTNNSYEYFDSIDDSWKFLESKIEKCVKHVDCR
jgi:hypothetical protein